MPHLIFGSYKVEAGKVVTLFREGRARAGEPPMVLVKPQSSIALPDDMIRMPEETKELSFRTMLGIAVSERMDRTRHDRMKGIMGYGMLLDIFDPQGLEKVRRRGHPWTGPSCQDGFTPLSEFVPPSDVSDPYALEVYVQVNGEEMVQASTRDLIIRIEDALDLVTDKMTLFPGDIVGIEIASSRGELRPGDLIEAGVSSIALLRNKVEGPLYIP